MQTSIGEIATRLTTTNVVADVAKVINMSFKVDILFEQLVALAVALVLTVCMVCLQPLREAPARKIPPGG